ncbi:hypothetical protein RND81_11G208100 [Saponaria officinalis]|uniref:Uncharacterized protein n=1 Tax=Saponaria officinalis TaxID=3572 RepID=A0AAW1HR95_SAPOF
MDPGTIMSVAQTLFAALQCSELKQLCRLFGYKSELDNLRRTVLTVRAVLKDAESKQDSALPLSNQAQLYIDDLKNAIYDADDLLDEFITVTQQKQRHYHDAATLAELRLFFSRLSVARKMSKNVAKIRNKLDCIATNYDQFGFKVDYEPIKARREETCSYVDSVEIIGREVDVDKLVGMLGCSSHGCNFVTVVGIGGLGKTALAQLVYNDERVKSEFSLRIWVCVSDQDSAEFGVKDILVKILRSVTGIGCGDFSMDQVQIEIREQLGKHKYLLVLDDVWTEDREQWLKLERFLKCGKEGSSVVVTTRSMETGRLVGNGVMHELEGLSLEHSRRFFEMTAFGEANPPQDLVEIGHQIVDKCANVPLAIRVIGSLLYGQTKSRWNSFRQKGLAYVDDGKKGIKSILKLSYHHLKSPLKSCFSYCALFPKDFVIEKETLIALWMAQGYVVPFSDGQSMEDAAEECFLILLRRCFFQDVRRNVCGEIVSCKIHDLMHDIAQDVAGKEISERRSNTTGLDERVRHISSSLVDENFLRRSPAATQIRTCFQVRWENKELLAGLILAKCVRLRTLTLNYLEVTVLPESIGNLVHLRYLDLSSNYKLKRLPKSLTKLLNLVTLKLFYCSGLKELPKYLSKLHKLQILDILGCYELKYLPSGIGKMANLHTLTWYIAGRESLNVKECFDQLKELKGLSNLKGDIEIEIHVPRNAKYVKEDDRGGAYMRNKERLNRIDISIEHVEKCESVEYEEALLEELQPHSNLMDLRVNGYKGVRIPRWLRTENLGSCLPRLVSLGIINCDGLEYLANLTRLSHLKTLVLINLPKLEYVVDEDVADGECVEQLLSFPCLEHVFLQRLPNLKYWVRGIEVNSDLRDCLPRVRKMEMIDCPKLSSNTSRPLVQGLLVYDCEQTRKIDEFIEYCEHITGSRGRHDNI